MHPSSPVKPSAPSAAANFDHLPLARPVDHAYLPPQAPSEDDSSAGGFLRTALRLGIFHFFNSALSSLGFVLVVVGAVGSLLLLPLCCFGIVTFRFLLYLVGFLAELDVSLYNFISPPQEHVYVSMPRQTQFFEFTGVRLSPNLSSFSPGALLVSLYFVTVKFVIGLLSSISLSVAFSFPISALSDDSVQDSSFGSFLGFLLFLFITTLLLLIGAALMKFAAGLSRAATRYFCCEKFSTYQYVQRANAYPSAVPTYGATPQSVV